LDLILFILDCYLNRFSRWNLNY